MNKERPVIQIVPGFMERMLGYAGWIMLAVMWWITLAVYPDLPQTIPVHYDLTGTPDRYGSRSSLLFLPVLGTVLFGGMTWLSRFPHYFNYPVRITRSNARSQYRLAIRLIRILSVSLLLIFSCIAWITRQKALGHPASGGWMFLILISLLLFIPVISYMILSFRADKREEAAD